MQHPVSASKHVMPSDAASAWLAPATWNGGILQSANDLDYRTYQEFNQRKSKKNTRLIQVLMWKICPKAMYFQMRTRYGQPEKFRAFVHQWPSTSHRPRGGPRRLASLICLRVGLEGLGIPQWSENSLNCSQTLISAIDHPFFVNAASVGYTPVTFF
jgi:hypothetical protein